MTRELKCLQNNNLATAQVRKDTLSLIDVRGLGRPKEFSGRGGFSTVVEETGGILRWCDQACRVKRIWTEECETWSRSRCTQHSWFSRVMKRMPFSPTRGRTRWRHGEGGRSDMIRRQEEENETFCARSFLLDGALFWNFKRGSSWESHVSRYEKEVKGQARR